MARRDLTGAQRRYLREIHAAGGSRTYNGRCRRTVEALEAKGLVGATWEPVDHGTDTTERWTVWLTARGFEAVAWRRWSAARATGITRRQEAVLRRRFRRREEYGTIAAALGTTPEDVLYEEVTAIDAIVRRWLELQDRAREDRAGGNGEPEPHGGG